MERQGPGSPEVTLKALSFVDRMPTDGYLIAVSVCGTGGQTMVLAGHVRDRLPELTFSPALLTSSTVMQRQLGLQDK